MSEAHTGTRPVTEKDGLDTARLAAWMQANVEGFSGELQIEKFKGGQSNPTFMLSAGGRKYVMRRKPPGTRANPTKSRLIITRPMIPTLPAWPAMAPIMAA